MESIFRPRALAAIEAYRAKEDEAKQAESEEENDDSFFGDNTEQNTTEEASQSNNESLFSGSNETNTGTTELASTKQGIVDNLKIQAGETANDYSAILKENVLNNLSLDAVERIAGKLTEIENIKNNSIANRRKRSELDDSDEKIIAHISDYRINPDNLTMDEAYDFYDFINNANEESINYKIEEIATVISGITKKIEKNRDEYPSQLSLFYDMQDDLRNWNTGKRNEIAYYDADVIVDELNSSFLRKFETTDGRLAIDVEKVIRRWNEQGLEDDMYRRTFLRDSHEEGLIDLIEEGYVEEEDFLGYGPLTIGELNLIEDAWYRFDMRDDINYRKKGSNSIRTETEFDEDGEITNRKTVVTPRPGSTLMSLLNETSPIKNVGDVEDIINIKYLEKFLESRRLPLREMTEATIAFVPEAMNVEKPKAPNDDDELQKKIDIAYAEMRRACRELCRHAAHMFYDKRVNIGEADKKMAFGDDEPSGDELIDWKLRKVFGTSKPTSDKFLKELNTHINNLSNEQIEITDKNDSRTIKMDENLHIAINNYEYLMGIINNKTGSLYSSDLD